jgi:hypothetical protein
MPLQVAKPTAQLSCKIAMLQLHLASTGMVEWLIA